MQGPFGFLYICARPPNKQCDLVLFFLRLCPKVWVHTGQYSPGFPWAQTLETIHCHPFPLWCGIGDKALSTAQHLQETFTGKMFVEKHQCLSSRGASLLSQGQSMYTDLESRAFFIGFGYLEGSFDIQHFRASLYTLW